MKKKPVVKINNFVAKHAIEFNKSAVFKDRKKELKNGKTKHKKNRYDGSYFSYHILKFKHILKF